MDGFNFGQVPDDSVVHKPVYWQNTYFKKNDRGNYTSTLVNNFKQETSRCVALSIQDYCKSKSDSIPKLQIQRYIGLNQKPKLVYAKT